MGGGFFGSFDFLCWFVGDFCLGGLCGLGVVIIIGVLGVGYFYGCGCEWFVVELVVQDVYYYGLVGIGYCVVVEFFFWSGYVGSGGGLFYGGCDFDCYWCDWLF